MLNNTENPTADAGSDEGRVVCLEGEIASLRARLSAAQQATTCARCGEYKHTPWRADDGYICAGCMGEENAVLRSQVENEDVNLAQVRLNVAGRYDAKINEWILALPSDPRWDWLRDEMRAALSSHNS